MSELLDFNISSSIKEKVAKEAANLLYIGVEKEYRQAKLKAAKTLRIHSLPSNLEIAIEFDKIAEENEGADRHKRLIKMRQEALNLMKILRKYNPVLVGSVWRGTIYRDSDIDIIIYCDEPNEILNLLKENKFHALQTEQMMVARQGQTKSSFHIYLKLPTNEKAEIIVRNHEEANQKEKCAIYGDEITGLRIRELEKVLKENSTQRFLPY